MIGMVFADLGRKLTRSLEWAYLARMGEESQPSRCHFLPAGLHSKRQSDSYPDATLLVSAPMPSSIAEA